MKERGAYSLIFLSSKLTRGLEVDAEVRIVALIVFADVSDSVDVERYGKSMHKRDDRLSFESSQHQHPTYIRRSCSPARYPLPLAMHPRPWNSGTPSTLSAPHQAHLPLPSICQDRRLAAACKSV